MTIIICPGIHEPELTESFISGWLSQISEISKHQQAVNMQIVPSEGFLALSTFHILQFLRDRLGNQLKSPIVFISFSAGVVGAIGAANLWQILGGNIKAFIALDGWGVPLWGKFPIHRVSHDYFTHWSSSLLGIGQNNFYADPPVDHLELWRSPQKVTGWWVNSSIGDSISKQHLTAAEFLNNMLLVKSQ